MQLGPFHSGPVPRSGTLPALDSFAEYAGGRSSTLELGEVGKFCFDFKPHQPGTVPGHVLGFEKSTFPCLGSRVVSWICPSPVVCPRSLDQAKPLDL